MRLLYRCLIILCVFFRYAFNRRFILPRRWLCYGLSWLNPFSYRLTQTRGELLAQALLSLGPIFTKFGQMLSTRHDMLSADMVAALSVCQDRVPPFCGRLALAMIEAQLPASLTECFKTITEQPLASASIAQVHAATLRDGTDVVVKILRPHIAKRMQQDVRVMRLMARIAWLLWPTSRRLRLLECVNEFEQTTEHEVDLLREAANASQLRRNFCDSALMSVPQVIWPYCTESMLVTERVHAIPISDVGQLKALGVNMRRLAENGVTIFFTQVFRDQFFHADMHPGNLFVDATDPENPKYVGVDFGIMGTLSPDDQYYLAENLLAFFQQDYRRIAQLHIDSGWVAPNTRVDQFESAIRTVSEPILGQALENINFGQLLLRLFQTAQRFDMSVQPQLLLLQKTLLCVEGLGRSLYPQLNLWQTAGPFMKQWGSQRRGLKNLWDTWVEQWQAASQSGILLPDLLRQILRDERAIRHQLRYQQRNDCTRGGKRLRLLLFSGLCGAAVSLIISHFFAG